MPLRRIAIATGTRADWGLLSPIARELAARPDCEVTILATNMHLLPDYGHTIAEVIADGFPAPVRIPMPADTDT
ncbi:MAG: UDP-N-acetylglucosamine 2-epimerase (hydrolyzing), partial [Duncaniella sp.]|nr:UDP-N-acetylglucosamine 2-epimerase (hydrolyzing) [Duncaniella sp.]